MPLTTASELPALLQKNQFGKVELVSSNSRLFFTRKLILSTILRECSAMIPYSRTQPPHISVYDHEPILFLVTQKNKPNHRVYKFQLILIKFLNLHIVWTEGKKLSLQDLLSCKLPKTTQDKHRVRTVIPDSIKFFMTHNQNTPPIQCHYAVSKEYSYTQSLQTLLKNHHIFPFTYRLKTTISKYN